MSSSWNAQNYQARHSYVWEFGEALIELLDPQIGQRILDLGCGAGQLTVKIAERGAQVVGIDASAEMIAQARANFPDLDFRTGDATSFQLAEPVDAVFSNAVLHWVKDQAGALRCIHRALKPGGRLVAELGGKGNIETIVSAAGANPWYFPGIADYSTMLETQGLEVRFATLFDRPTRIEGENGLKDWLEMFGAALTTDPRALAERLRPRMFRDGAWTLDYRRLQVVAVKRS
jgi:trans-aconitate methyltransferase